jgi:hypothetical protein
MLAAHEDREPACESELGVAVSGHSARRDAGTLVDERERPEHARGQRAW